MLLFLHTRTLLRLELTVRVKYALHLLSLLTERSLFVIASTHEGVSVGSFGVQSIEFVVQAVNVICNCWTVDEAADYIVIRIEMAEREGWCTHIVTLHLESGVEILEVLVHVVVQL